MRQFSSLLLSAVLVALGTASGSAVQVLTFEGLKDQESVNNYNNGGAGSLGSSGGPNYGISFSSDSLALISGVTGNFSNNPSGSTILFFLSGTDTMNIAAGFDTGFSFYYAASQSGFVNIYDGLNGTGSLLASIFLSETPNPYTVWVNTGVAFSGTAHSAVFGGAADHIGFDNVTLGSSVAQQTSSVPDGGSTVALLSLALTGMACVRRKLASY